MEKIVVVGCRFWVALKRLKLCIFGKNWKLGYPETKTQPTKSKKNLALNVGQVPGGIYKAFSFSIKPHSCVLHFFKN